MKIGCKFLIFFLIIFIQGLFANSDTLSPKSNILYSQWVKPLASTPYLEYSEGEEGIYKMLELLNSDISKRLLIDPLLRKNVRVDFSYVKIGVPHIAINVYTINPMIMEIIDNYVFVSLDDREHGNVTGINEYSLGRIVIRMARKDGHTVPILWEVQPSASWRFIQQYIKRATDKNPDLRNVYRGLNWRKNTAVAFARFCSIIGFKEIYARSGNSIRHHPDFKNEYMKHPFLKEIINPRDVKENYERTFANRGHFQKEADVPFKLWVDQISNEVDFISNVHEFTHNDRILNELFMKKYTFKEIKTNKGYSIVVVFENSKEDVAISWQLNVLLNHLEKIMDKSFDEDIEEIYNTFDVKRLTALLRFKHKIPVFEITKPDKPTNFDAFKISA
ncbi:MAG: hypothetical protein ACD_79C01042G0001 [uncultured bacterium]|nr:MAG: hypothetical protein ACD_79C01042G0001 [uncultured bacterium]